MSEDNTNIFFHNQEKEGGSSEKAVPIENPEFELTDEDGRNKVRANIYKALTGSDDVEELKQMKFSPVQLTQLIEEALLAEFKD